MTAAQKEATVEKSRLAPRLSPVVTRAHTRHLEKESKEKQKLQAKHKNPLSRTGLEQEEHSDSDEPEEYRSVDGSETVPTMSQNELAGEAAAALTNVLTETMTPVFEEITRKIRTAPTVQLPRGPIPPFSGDISSNFYTWIKAFETVMSADIGMTDSEKKRKIAGYLTGRAGRIYRALPEPLKALDETEGNTWRDLKRALERGIIDEQTRQFHRRQFQLRTQGPEEDTAAFVDWLENEARIVFPSDRGDPQRLSEHVKEQFFMSSRMSKELNRMYPPPATLDEAMNAALQIEGNMKLEGSNKILTKLIKL